MPPAENHLYTQFTHTTFCTQPLYNLPLPPRSGFEPSRPIRGLCEIRRYQLRLMNISLIVINCVTLCFPGHDGEMTGDIVIVPVIVLVTLTTLKKSSSLRVATIFSTVALAISMRSPFMLPLESIKITMSFGDAAAWMYLYTVTSSVT